MNKLIILLLFFSNVIHSQIDLENSLELHYNFDGNVIDESNNSNDGIILGGGMYEPSFFGESLLFDGDDDYVSINNSLQFTNTFSISTWVYLNTTNIPWQTVISKYETNNFGPYWFGFQNNKVNMWVSDGNGGFVSFDSNTSIQPNMWYHIVWIGNNGEGRFYINCNEDSSIEAIPNMTQNDDLVTIGRQALPVGGRNADLDGKMEELRIYNRVLTEDELNLLCLQQIDCAGTPNGTSVIDDCGNCLEPNDPSFNDCIDCAGVLNGTSVIDDCGNCLEPNDPSFNDCIDCAGVLNGTAVLDDCGICLEPSDPDFNQSCIDCAGVPNGTSVIDDCGNCLEPNDPSFNDCIDCVGIPNGAAVIDDCGNCLEPNDPDFNQSCIDCAGVPNGTSVIDGCGDCLEPNDPNFNRSCADKNVVYIPSAFSPNNDGINDSFQVFAESGIVNRIKKYLIFDRYGGVIFEALNIDPVAHKDWWDGSFKNKELNTNVYAYFVEIEFLNGDIKQYKGDVTIIK